MALATASIEKWATGIRQRMANDPGRQDLEDHILCNGFLFLDEYLEDILLGPRSEPIIELTKTPGRRKDTSKKDRVATTASVKTLQSPDKENVPVQQSSTRSKKVLGPTPFQKALLKASREKQPKTLPQIPTGLKSDPQNPFRSEIVAARNTDDEAEAAVAVLTTPSSKPTAVAAEPKASILLPSLSANGVQKPLDPDFGPPSTSNPSIASPGVDLSVIAEGDERDMSRGSLASNRPPGPVIRDKEISYRIPADPNNTNGAMSTVTVSYNPNTDDDDDAQAFPSALDRTFNDSETTSTASSFPIDPYARDYETHELPHIVPEHPSPELPHPHSPPAPTLIRKASVPVFPSLPGPSPLRKSMRDSAVVGPSAGNMRPIVTTGTVTGTRSSWLNKARDVTAKRTSVVSGVKRKSGELTGDVDYRTTTEVYARATKAAKTRAESGVSDAFSDKEKSQGKVVMRQFKPVVPAKAKEQPHELSEAHVATPDGNSEGMMNILKRTVEGLGARVGKSMGKSLGGAAATAAAAEAKAAAEARLAQREAKGSDGTRQGRLSVSDLVGPFETSGAGKGKEREPSDLKLKPLSPPPVSPVPASRASVSTTPPDSPPAPRSQIASSPGHTTILKFTVQRPVTKEPSFGLPESQPSQPSTQSTYLSSIFDDPSTWPQSSLGTEYTASQSFSQPRDHAPVYDHKGSDLLKGVSWAQSQENPVIPHDETVGRMIKHGKESPSAISRAPEDTAYRLPGSFEPEDQGIDLKNGVQQPDDGMGSEEAHGESASTSSDSTEPKPKAGSSQENITTSVQPGLVSQASTLLSKVMGSSVGTAMGSSKRGKPEPVKSIQLAAAAAKKQQEEADRKAARLREMDKRRAAIASKKADQDAAEKSKQQGDRHKREREETAERNVRTVKKAEEEVTKKRKVVVEIEKKPQGKKPLSKDKRDLGSSRIGKPGLNTSLTQSQLASSSMSKSFKQPGLPASASQPSVKLVGHNQGEPKSAPSLKVGGPINGLEDVRQPSQTLHAQMQARVQAQMLQARQEEPIVPSESIELPDINSEYSNSDDEDRPRTFDPPDWAQSPVLGLALQSQSRLNPDDIFGPVRPLRMEEIFKTRHSRFRARTSSANWAGTDELTTDEQREYAKRMGYLD